MSTVLTIPADELAALQAAAAERDLFLNEAEALVSAGSVVPAQESIPDTIGVAPHQRQRQGHTRSGAHHPQGVFTESALAWIVTAKFM